MMMSPTRIDGQEGPHHSARQLIPSPSSSNASTAGRMVSLRVDSSMNSPSGGAFGVSPTAGVRGSSAGRRRWCRSETMAEFLSVGSSVAMWYVSSVSITALNKLLFDSLGFNYPLLVTTVHFTFVSLLLRVGFAALPCFPEFPQVTRSMFFKFILPISFFAAAEIALSNVSYAMVSISVMTVVKSSLVVWTYFLGIVCGLEVFKWRLLATIGLIIGSISFTVPEMDIRNKLGVFCLCVAVVAAAIRWVIVHHQLQRQMFKPSQLMLLTQPTATICLMPGAVYDANSLINKWTDDGIDAERCFFVILLCCLAVVLSFFLLYSEYNLVKKTSSVSLTVAGVGKEVATILMSMIGFREHIPWRAVVGIGLSIVGIVIYSKLRYNDHLLRQQRLPPSPPMSNRSGRGLPHDPLDYQDGYPEKIDDDEHGGSVLQEDAAESNDGSPTVFAGRAASGHSSRRETTSSMAPLGTSSRLGSRTSSTAGSPLGTTAGSAFGSLQSPPSADYGGPAPTANLLRRQLPAAEGGKSPLVVGQSPLPMMPNSAETAFGVDPIV